MLDITKLQIPLSVIAKDAHLILLEVQPYYDYKDGKKTDTRLGYKYTVVEDRNFEKFPVKIPGNSPAISKEQLENAKSRIFVSFDNAAGKFYRTDRGDYALSVTASDVSIVKQ